MPEEAASEAKNAAAEMLAAALREYTARHPGGLRSLAAKLGLKQAAVLSHMANGRMAIPLDRASSLAKRLGLEEVEFTLAVIAARYPEAAEVLRGPGIRGQPGCDAALRQIVPLLAGSDELTSDRIAILAEVIRDPKPEERWLKVSEIAVIKDLRRLRPNGLTQLDHDLVHVALADGFDSQRRA